jgi:tetratricopeptide (TPR) repeat protein
MTRSMRTRRAFCCIVFGALSCAVAPSMAQPETGVANSTTLLEAQQQIHDHPYFVKRAEITAWLDAHNSESERREALAHALRDAMWHTPGEVGLEIVRWLGAVAARENMDQQARQAFKHVLERDTRPGGRADTLRLLAQVDNFIPQQQEEHYRAAIKELETPGDTSFVSIDGEHEIWTGLARSLERQRLWKAAAETYELAATKLATRLDPARTGHLYLNAARLLVKAEQPAEAIPLYDTVLIAYPETLVDQGDREFAVRMEAAKLQGTRPEQADALVGIWHNHIRKSGRTTEISSGYTISESLERFSRRDLATDILIDLVLLALDGQYETLLAQEDVQLGPPQHTLPVDIQTTTLQGERETLATALVRFLSMSKDPRVTDQHRLAACELLLGPLQNVVAPSVRASVAQQRGALRQH